MVRVHVLRGVIASGQRLVAGTSAEISDGDARILIASSKVVLAPPAPIEMPALEVGETAAAPMRETATRSSRRKATLQ
jgi:hypothetical protein